MPCIDARDGQEQKYIEQFGQFAYVPAFFFFFFFFGVATSAADFNNNASLLGRTWGMGVPFMEYRIKCMATQNWGRFTTVERDRDRQREKTYTL